jgi:hypothetical protein
MLFLLNSGSKGSQVLSGGQSTAAMKKKGEELYFSWPICQNPAVVTASCS